MLNELRAKMPPFEGREILRTLNADNADLRSDLEKLFPAALQQVQTVAERFRGATAHETAENVHRFVRANIIYLADSPKNQVIKLPSALIHDLFADCKSISLFCAATVSACGFPVFNKYASYRDTSPAFPVPSHVYVIVGTETDYITLDGTNPAFNTEKEPGFFLLKKLPDMDVKSLSEEMLTADSASDFFKRMCNMTAGQRLDFLKQFSEANQEKILRALRSVVKMGELDAAPDYPNPSAAILFSNPPGMWETWGQMFYKYNTPYSRQTWTSGNVNFQNIQFLSEQYTAGTRGVNDERLAGNERLAGETSGGRELIDKILVSMQNILNA